MSGREAAYIVVSICLIGLLLLALLVALSGCASSNDDMIKVYEPRVVLVEWKREAPTRCGPLAASAERQLHGCTTTTHQGAVCRIEMREDAPDWVIAHEFRHCFGYAHRRN